MMKLLSKEENCWSFNDTSIFRVKKFQEEGEKPSFLVSPMDKEGAILAPRYKLKKYSNPRNPESFSPTV
jgi:hypothetical protein